MVVRSSTITDRSSVLIVCGGAGGEGSFLADRGFCDVTVSDLRVASLDVCRTQDRRLQTLVMNAEALPLEDASYDVVLVQDGLHHLPRPALGLTEMLRVARTAVVVIEPHYGLVARLLGTEYEHDGGETNYVFRWSRSTFGQTVRSFLPNSRPTIRTARLWDHNLVIFKLTNRLPKPTRLPVAKVIYLLLRPFNRLGNMFIGVAVKSPET